MSREEAPRRSGSVGPSASLELSTQGTEGGPVPERVAAWLGSLARAVQRYALYPPGHPALGDLVEDLHGDLEPLLEEEGALVVAISPDRLLYRGAWTDPGNPHLPGLAGRLHEHHLAALGIEPGASVSELRAVLTVLRERPKAEADRLGRRAGMTARWPHVWVEPRHYEKLRLDEDLPDEEREARDRRAARLWLGLARAAGAGPDEAEGDGAEADAASGDGPDSLDAARALQPERVAQGIGRIHEQELLQHVGDALVAIAAELDQAEGDFSLRERFGDLFGALDRDEVRRLLSTGLASDGRRQILGAGSPFLPAGPLVGMVETAADLGDIDVSYWMLRILVKLAGYANAEGSLSSPEAQQALRTLVEQAVTGWSDEARAFDEAYEEALRTMAESDSDQAEGSRAGSPEPLRILQMAIEVDELGAPGEEAYRAMRAGRRVGEILVAVDDAPEGSGVADTLRERLLDEEVVRELAETEPPDLEALDRIARHIPRVVAPPLLDILEHSHDRSVRGKAFSILTGLGQEVADLVVSRLRDERWFVQRNMLALLYEIGAPEGFTARPFTTHERAQVRREAYKHLLRDAATREDAVRMMLRETESRTLTLGLGAVDGIEEPGPDLTPLVAGHAADPSNPREVRVQAIRALDHLGGPVARRTLMRICERRHPILFWRRRLAPPSAPVREAVATLARHWPRDPAAQRVLRGAAASDDSGLRKAARLAEVPE